MNKNKFKISNIFNGKLFVEAFKQIRVVGLIFFVCLPMTKDLAISNTE